ncbi:L-asparaginase 1-like [Uloborus diversus]|uniref:L-asparaginase 1-like n=1 Tax=Uloborus diversus TaxID=327109 RepID=UPI0024096939|nr:L-asparaginase 1-like [Uloborus diversus]
MHSPNTASEEVCSDSIIDGKEDTLQNSVRSETTLKNSSSLHKIKGDGYSKVLVLYTGGTIGMLRTESGVYAPETSIMEKRIKLYPQLHDTTAAEDYAIEHPEKNFMILPDTGETARVLYVIREYVPLLDSSNMTMDDWIRIAMDIKESYEQYNGFVVLHGTDTMAYTASALSFMLENLGKTVVITGSQIPLYEARSDGRDNLMNALIVAGNYVIPEVTILFNNKLFRGNRTSKISTSNLDAFNSPNLPPLAKMGIGIHVEWRNVYRPSSIEKFNVHSLLNRNVGLLRLFPSITVEVVRAFLSPPIEGVVLQTYGAGNGPSQRRDLFDEFKRAFRRGVIIVNCTQCSLGQVDPSYETGSALMDVGVVPGSDMTPEAALTKLSYVLSKKEWSLQTKRTMMEANLRGELTVHKDAKFEDLDVITAVVKTLNLSSAEEVDALRDAISPAILCSIVSEGNLEKLEIMRQFGAYLSACDYDYKTPLHIACSDGNLKIVEYLLKHGASIHMRDREHRTPLMNAVVNDHHEVIKLIVKAGGYLNLPSLTIGEMLCSYAKQGDLTRLESLRLAGADLNDPDCTNRTCLHYAAEMNLEEVVSYLLKHNVCKSAQDLYGRTACDIAKVLEHDSLVKLLQLENAD